MCEIDWCDDDGIWLKELKTIRAAKEHKCHDCGRVILKGERYTYGVWKSDDLMDVKVCAHCVAAGEWLNRVCSGHLWPGVCRELLQHWREEPIYRSLAFGRMVVASRRWWKDSSGERYTVEQIAAWTAEAIPEVYRKKAA